MASVSVFGGSYFNFCKSTSELAPGSLRWQTICPFVPPKLVEWVNLQDSGCRFIGEIPFSGLEPAILGTPIGVPYGVQWWGRNSYNFKLEGPWRSPFFHHQGLVHADCTPKIIAFGHIWVVSRFGISKYLKMPSPFSRWNWQQFQYQFLGTSHYASFCDEMRQNNIHSLLLKSLLLMFPHFGWWNPNDRL